MRLLILMDSRQVWNNERDANPAVTGGVANLGRVN